MHNNKTKSIDSYFHFKFKRNFFYINFNYILAIND